MGLLQEDLLSPKAFPPPRPKQVELVETHISWVFLGGREAYKVKKPVNLGFLDYGTPELRRRACEAEVRLNARLAPRAYLGVVPVTRSPAGAHRLGGSGEVVDWAVHMVRQPDERRLDRLLERGALGYREIDRLAAKLAAFHAGARCDAETGRFGEPEAIALNLRENLEQTRGDAEAAEATRWQLTFLEKSRGVFSARVREGRARDGHGDLRLQQIYLAEGGELTILDCIEFNDRFRYADVCADLAFLSMDLAYHGRADLGERLLARYARDSDDFGIYAVVDFYQSYRACVRGKVALFLASDLRAPESLRSAARAEAKRYFRLALAVRRPSLAPPAVVTVGGLIASGKSTVADRLGARLGAPVIDADHARKSLLGVPVTRTIAEPAWTGAYDPGFSERVYDELIRRAGSVLDSGRAVILDASFRTAALRAKARALARAQSAPFRFVECRAPLELCRRRLLEREGRENVSDARAPLLGEFAARYEPVSELPPEEHVVLDTSGEIQDSEVALMQRLALPASRSRGAA